MVKPSPHIMVGSFPLQGHINPGLQLAKRLVSMGVQVTFVTTVFAFRLMNKTTSLPPEGLSFGSFSDGHDDGIFKPGDDVNHFMTEFRRVGSQTLSEFIVTSTRQGNHYSCIVYSILLPWVEEVVAAVNIPTTTFWIQTATMFDIYHYFFNGYGDVIRNSINETSFSLKLEGLPELANHDLPSFFDPSNHSFVLPLFQEQMKLLDGKSHSKVLVNTFDALESEALKAMSKYNLVGIGPLIPSAFLDGKDPSDTSFGGDLVKGTTTCKDYMEWLDSRSESSVIYVSFGSISMLSRPQMEELAQGLLKTGRPFLWVIREKREEEKKEDDEELSCVKELEEQGKIVTWCSQVEVLSHKSLGCFMTHCGWNSTFESFYSGVPMVAFPQWTDQATNAKMVEDVWKIGVRVNFNNQGIVDRDEFYKCLELVMGSKEMRDNAKKWMELAREAAKEGGSSHKNLQEFVDEISIL